MKGVAVVGNVTKELRRHQMNLTQSAITTL